MLTESSTSIHLSLMALQTLPPPPPVGHFDETLQATQSPDPDADTEAEPVLEGDALLASFIDLL
ncbi:MAG: hypothetical protein ACI8S6_005448 [Myxococcota bacterium]|jgi:hypothetical protein